MVQEQDKSGEKGKSSSTQQMTDEEFGLESVMTRSSSQGGSVVVAGTKYAVGLSWAPLQNQDDPIPEIREAMAAEPGADLYCQRSATTPQYGLGKTVLGHRSGEPALAASVATALSGKTSSCCVFELDEGWWFIAIRNDLILAEEDILFHTEDEARKAFFAMMAVPDWDIRIVPAEWAVEGSVQQDLASLIENIRKSRLFEISAAKKTQILVLLALGVIIALAFLFYIAISFLASVFEQKPVVELPKPTVVRPQEPKPDKPKPWERVPQMEAFVNRCWNNAYQLEAVTMPYYAMSPVSCTPQGISTSWSMRGDRGARLAWLKYALNKYKLNRISVDMAPTGRTASGTGTFTDIPMEISLPTFTKAQLLEQLTDIQQATALPIHFSEQTVKDPPDNPDGTKPPNQQVYTYFNFSIPSPYSPEVWKTFFNKFSGLEMTKITYHPGVGAGNKWTYEGRIYAK